jgi:hypothetical protein
MIYNLPDQVTVLPLRYELWLAHDEDITLIFSCVSIVIVSCLLDSIHDMDQDTSIPAFRDAQLISCIEHTYILLVYFYLPIIFSKTILDTAENHEIVFNTCNR